MNAAAVIGALMAALPEEEIRDDVKELADKLIDKAENLIEKTPTKIDDMLLLPLIKTGRRVFNIPDNDEAKAGA